MAAIKYDIPASTLFNLVESESSWNPAADNGKDRGLVQINRKSFPDVTDKQAFDPEFALNFAAKLISEDKSYLWTVCSCTKYVHVLDKSIPIRNADHFTPNSSAHVGALAIFHYPNGISHVALVISIHGATFSVRESNYLPCKTDTRDIAFTNSSLYGFWDVD